MTVSGPVLVIGWRHGTLLRLVQMIRSVAGILSQGGRSPRTIPVRIVAAREAALGRALAPVESRALRHRETRVPGQGGVPCGARAPEVGGAPPCLVELRMHACSAEAGLCAELQPHGIGRPLRHETQDRRLSWPRPSALASRERERGRVMVKAL